MLTPRQTEVLKLLSAGKNYDQIRVKLGLSPANLHLICWQLRKKTGVDTRQPAICAAYKIENVDKPLPPISPAQRSVLLLIAQGKTYAEICATLGINAQTAQNHACQGAKRLGVSGHGAGRVNALQVKLGLVEPVPRVTMADPFFN